MTLTEFLLARIAEDAELVEDQYPHWANCDHFLYFSEGGMGCTCGLSDRLLAECEAKRRAIEAAWTDHMTIEGEWGLYRSTEELEALNDQPMVVRYLAQPYADHPDFKPEWRV